MLPGSVRDMGLWAIFGRANPERPPRGGARLPRVWALADELGRLPLTGDIAGARNRLRPYVDP